MAKTVTISIDVETGSFRVDGTLFRGEEVRIVWSGVDKAPEFHVFAADGATVLADNSCDSGKLDLRLDELRKAFHGSHAPHHFMAFAKTENPEVLCRGLVCVNWAPYTYDAATGKFVTMKGDKGDRGYSVESIEKVGENAEGYVYRAWFEDGRYSDFVTPYGPRGQVGPKVSSVNLVREDSGGRYYAIVLEDGSSFEFMAPRGPKGENGGLTRGQVEEVVGERVLPLETALGNKQDKIYAGANLSLDAAGHLEFTGNLVDTYEELGGLPQIDGHELRENNTSDELGLAKKTELGEVLVLANQAQQAAVTAAALFRALDQAMGNKADKTSDQSGVIIPYSGFGGNELRIVYAQDINGNTRYAFEFKTSDGYSCRLFPNGDVATVNSTTFGTGIGFNNGLWTKGAIKFGGASGLAVTEGETGHYDEVWFSYGGSVAKLKVTNGNIAYVEDLDKKADEVKKAEIGYTPWTVVAGGNPVPARSGYLWRVNGKWELKQSQAAGYAKGDANSLALEWSPSECAFEGGVTATRASLTSAWVSSNGCLVAQEENGSWGLYIGGTTMTSVAKGSDSSTDIEWSESETAGIGPVRATRTLVYKMETVVRVDESGNLPSKVKAALFAEADFTAAVEAVFDNGETEAF